MPTAYTATGDGLFVASESDGWEVAACLRDARPECVAVAPTRPERVFAGTFDSGLHRSPDGGGTTERVGEATLPDRVLSVAVSPHDQNVVWAGTEPSRVFRSTDGGDTWAECPGLADLPSAERWSFPPRPDTHHVRWLEPDPADPERLYVGVEAGAFVRSDDGGETWVDHPDGARRDNHTLEAHADAPGLVYSAAGDGFGVSRDGGETWTVEMDGLGHRYCWSVVADPGDPERLVLSAASGPGAAHSDDGAESYVYRRVGDGAWERVESDTLPTGEGVTRAVLATTGEGGVVYAANDHGLFRSGDAGRTWTRLAAGWPGDGTTVRGLAAVP